MGPARAGNVRFLPIADIRTSANLRAMELAYLLQHERPDAEDVKVIGVYSSQLEAEAAIKRLSKQPGFRDYLGGFTIDAYELDQDNWTEGFVDL